MCGSMNEVNYHLEEELLFPTLCEQVNLGVLKWAIISSQEVQIAFPVKLKACQFMFKFIQMIAWYATGLNLFWFNVWFLFWPVLFKEVTGRSVQCMQRVQVSARGWELCVCVCAWGGIFRRWVMLEDVHRKIIWLELMPLDRMWSNIRTFRDKFHFVLEGMQNESGCYLRVRITWVQSV